MGATAFTHKIISKTPHDGYQELVETAIAMYGPDPYNGTISTCDMGMAKKSFRTYQPENEEMAMSFIEEFNYGEKYVADYVDLGELTDGYHAYIFYGWASE